MKGRKRLWSVLLAALLLAGCGGPAASGAVSLAEESQREISVPDSVAASQPEEPFVLGAVPEGLEAWRLAYYEVAKEYVAGKDGLFLRAVNIYKAPDRQPVMVMELGRAGQDGVLLEGQGVYSVWEMGGEGAHKMAEVQEEEMPEDTFMLTGNYRVAVRTWANREPGRGQMLFEWDSGQWNPLYEIYNHNEIELPLTLEDPYFHNYELSRTYTLREYLSASIRMELGWNLLPLEHSLQLWGSGKHNRMQQLAEYLLQIYVPPVPEEAPDWVADYIRFIRGNISFAPGASLRNGELPVEYSYLYSLLGFFDNYMPYAASPLLEMRGLQPLPDCASYIFAGQAGITGLHNLYEAGYEFWVDGAGRMLVERWSYWYRDWYVFQQGTLLPLFGADYGFLFDGTAPYASVNGHYAQFLPENESETSAWMEEQISTALAAYGYRNLTAATYTEYKIEDCETWAELEAALIDVFCSHARMMGQWG